MTTAVQLGAVDDANRPIFEATEHTKFAPSLTRDLTDQEQIAWKSFQLWRSAKAMERRDVVYNTLINGDFSNYNVQNNIMGTPFPIVEPFPSTLDAFLAIRWYEHVLCIAAGKAYSMWAVSRSERVCVRVSTNSHLIIAGSLFAVLEIFFAQRSAERLTGHAPNDHECRKYGVLEDPERLARKKELWARYAAYKKEWCRRYDYHVYGIRPGENFSLFSACWVPSLELAYCKETNYPPRKNPYFLTTTPLRDMFTEDSSKMYVNPSDSVPLIKAKPELKYIYRGPRVATQSTKY